MMTIEQRIALLIKLGEYLQQDTDARQFAVMSTERKNRWLTKTNCLQALNSFATEFLTKEKLEKWAAKYPTLVNPTSPKKIGLVLAGNIPAVGFHDVLTVFMAGHHALIKFSEKDAYLIPYMIAFMAKEEESSKVYFEETALLKGFDAVIATGSNNSAMYFEQYFSKYPNIIRKNRNSVAILDGTETDEDLLKLGADVFGYFGLGCRSISKIYVPRDYDFNHLMATFDGFSDLMDHTKYRNNYEYNRSIYLLNNVKHLANDCVMVLEHESMLSRISSVHYEYYDNEEDLDARLESVSVDIQCIATKMVLKSQDTVALGQTQSPGLEDYADGLDTLQFLVDLTATSN
jgi:hypothetical protein